MITFSLLALRDICATLHFMNKTLPFSMRLQPELKEQLQRLAERDRRSLTNYVEKALIEHVEACALRDGQKGSKK